MNALVWQELPTLLPDVSSCSLEDCISAWIAETFRRSGSEKTRIAYTSTITAFRERLAKLGLDLTDEAGPVALCAASFAATGEGGRLVAPATYNQRLAILSSFYQFARRAPLITANPIDQVARRPRTSIHAALPMPDSEIAQRLSAIDRTTLAGSRDYALLSVGFTTGRRIGELAAMRYGHLSFSGRRLLVMWPRCKGAKVMHDVLQPKTASALMEYLHGVYGRSRQSIDTGAPIWISLSHHHAGGALSSQAIADICARHLGDPRGHILRHSFAIAMEKAGASLAEIGDRLGHSDLKTTAEYLKRLHAAENAYGERLETMFGI